MVGRGHIKGFVKEECGISMLEALLSMPILMIVFTAMVECGALMFQWNQTVKAVQIGARLAAVSSPLASSADMATLTSDWSGIDDGDPVPGTIRTVSCGAGATNPCQSDALNRLMTGGDGACGGNGSLPVGICDISGTIEASNVRVSYHRAGLGYVGRPNGPVVTVTVEVRDITFDFLVLDALIPALSNIPIPAHPVSITGEDLNDCLDTCS